MVYVSIRGLEINGNTINFRNISAVYYSQQTDLNTGEVYNDCHVISADKKHIAYFTVNLNGNDDFWKLLVYYLKKNEIPFILDPKYHGIPLDKEYNKSIKRKSHFLSTLFDSETPVVQTPEKLAEKKHFGDQLAEDIMLTAATSYVQKKEKELKRDPFLVVEKGFIHRKTSMGWEIKGVCDICNTVCEKTLFVSGYVKKGKKEHTSIFCEKCRRPTIITYYLE